MPFATEAEQIRKFENDEVAQHYFEVLRTLISKKSIFAQQVGLKEVANYLGEIFTAAGAKVEVDDSYTAPFVIAKFFSPILKPKPSFFITTMIRYQLMETNLGRETLLPYRSIMEPCTVEGVDDDKGHITARLTALRKYIRESGDLPVNITFIIEGAEESASTDLDKYLAKHKKHLRGADLLVWEQGTRNNQGQLEISGGSKGIVTFDMVVKSAEVDIHSSYGGVVDSASWYLLNAIASLRDKEGRILVDGIYDQIQEPNERELALIEQYANKGPEDVAETYGLTLPILKEDRKEFLRRFYFEPALNIEGFGSGYQGQGVKTILPAEARAKMEVRLVPGLDPKDVLEKIKQQLKKNGYDQVELVYTLGEMSYRSDMSAPSILNVIRLAKDFYREGVSVLPTTAGTGPMHTVFEALQVPMAAFGIGNANSRDHGGDENVKIADYYTHIELIKELIASYE